MVVVGEEVVGEEIRMVVGLFGGVQGRVGVEDVPRAGCSGR